MRLFIYISFLILSCAKGVAQTDKPIYNQALADSLGADQYGMKHYFLVMLKTGGTVIEDKAKVGELFKGHMENIGRLAKAGKLIVAGPFEKNDKNYRGLFIFALKTKAEVEEILQTDPAVKADLLGAEIFPWYGSAALPLYLQYHESLQKTKM